MAEEKDLQQNYLQFQLLQQQIEQISQQLEIITQRLADVEISQDALKQLEEVKEGQEIMANIAPGIFIKAAAKENKNLLVNVGADTMVEKPVQEVIELLEKQKKEMEKTAASSDLMLQTLTQEALKIYEQLEKE
ncbi:MAG: prefoldin subunit alpha [Candidatus Woesearchaeota archaeon]